MLDLSKAIRKDIYISPTGNKQNVYVFECLNCKCEMKKTAYYAKKAKGYCTKCTKNYKPKELENKVCKICKVNKSLEHFNLRPDSTTGRHRNECKDCVNINRQFKLTSIDYNNMLKAQNNCCAICDSQFSHIHRSGKKAKLAVDHCHKTGKIRGLLCSRCNNGLGQFKDDEKLFLKAIEYLKK